MTRNVEQCRTHLLRKGFSRFAPFVLAGVVLLVLAVAQVGCLKCETGCVAANPFAELAHPPCAWADELESKSAGEEGASRVEGADETGGEEAQQADAQDGASTSSQDDAGGDAQSGESQDATSESSASEEAGPSSASADADSADDDSNRNYVEEGNLVDPTQRADNTFIYDTTIGSLYDQAQANDARTVQVVGEVIGDKISAIGEAGYCWITLTAIDADDKSSISVLLSDDVTQQIDHYGRYGVTGTILQVRGTYHQACPDHEGLPDIHATTATAVKRGQETPDLPSFDIFVPGMIAVAIGLIMMLIYYLARERSR